MVLPGEWRGTQIPADVTLPSCRTCIGGEGAHHRVLQMLDARNPGPFTQPGLSTGVKTFLLSLGSPNLPRVVCALTFVMRIGVNICIAPGHRR